MQLGAKKLVISFFFCVSLICVLSACIEAKVNRPLRIYFIDVEGGQSTLVISPEKKSLLIDAGWAGGRDADRIVAAMKAAGVNRIDYLVVTHYHRDHAGGVPELAARVKIGTFVDHGPDIEDTAQAKDLFASYTKAVGHAAHLVVQPGEGLPFHDITVQFVAAAGKGLSGPLPGAGQANPYCASQPPSAPDTSENSQSLGLLISFHRFRFMDLGDLTAGKELQLVCPNNFLGTVDLYLVTHHGADLDNPKALVWALRPRVAVTNNGAEKGGDPSAWQIVHDSPGLLDLWQLHYAKAAGKDHNVDADHIANTDDKADGNFIEVTAWPDGKFKVRNSRNGYERAYVNQ